MNGGGRSGDAGGSESGPGAAGSAAGSAAGTAPGGLVTIRRAAADGGYRPADERGVNFAAVLAESRGANPDLVLEPPEWDGPPADAAEAVWRALHEVSDPEFPISLVDLGLIYGIEVEEGRAVVTVSFTATACPCTEFIKWDIRERLLEEPRIDGVEVRVTWDPPWTVERISERGRAALARAGVSL